MDYPFYVKRIDTLPGSLLERYLASLQQHKDSWQANKYFSGTPIQSLKSNDPVLYQLGQDLLQFLSPWFDPKSFLHFSFNKIEAGVDIHEHSDINTYNGTRAMHYVQCHKVHIPLITNEQVWSFHRRSNGLPMWSCKMQQGGVYLYNDYAWHSGFNRGDTERIHLLVNYKDEDWSQRLKALTRLGYSKANTFEDEQLPLSGQTI